MKIFAEFRSERTPEFESVELIYSILCLDPGGKWFCRIWHKYWFAQVGRGKKTFGEAYGKNKFQAYRNALRNLSE